MRKIYRLRLTQEERRSLELLTRSSKIAALKVIKARALLLADESAEGNGWKDPKIIEATGIKPATLTRLRQRCCEVGPMEALERKRQRSPSKRRLLDGKREAQLIAIACSEAPDGYSKWTLQLIVDQLVALEVVRASVVRPFVRLLKKQTQALVKELLVHST